MIQQNLVYILKTYGGMRQFCASPILNVGQKPSDLIQNKYEGYCFPIIHLSEDIECRQNRIISDFLCTGWLSECVLINDKVLNILLNNNIQGWKTYPVEVYDRKEHFISGYHGLTITGRCTKLDPTLAVPFEKLYPNQKYYTEYKGYPLDLSSWDGTDIFLTSGHHSIFVTLKLKQLLTKNKISGINFVDTASYTTRFPWK